MSAVSPHAPKVDVVDWRGEKQLVANVDLQVGELIVGELPVAFAKPVPAKRRWRPGYCSRPFSRQSPWALPLPPPI